MSNRKFKNYNEVKAAAEGNWAYVLSRCAPELELALEAASTNRGPSHVACPVHGGVDGFRLFKDFNLKGGGICNSCGSKTNGFAMISWIRGYEIKDAIREVAECLGDDSSYKASTTRASVAYKPVESDTRWAYNLINKAWRESKSIKGTPVSRYLVNRGIPEEFHPVALRFHPNMPYFERGNREPIGHFPCLLAPVLDEAGKMVTLHRIFLDEGGNKAPVPDAKRIMSAIRPLGGARIPLYPLKGSKVLGVAEGIETAAAAFAATGIPTWSSITAVLLEQMAIPPGIERVIIWEDLDASQRGAEASAVLKPRLEAMGIAVDVYTPTVPLVEGLKSIDWLDMWVLEGLEAFPKSIRRVSSSVDRVVF